MICVRDSLGARCRASISENWFLARMYVLMALVSVCPGPGCCHHVRPFPRVLRQGDGLLCRRLAQADSEARTISIGTGQYPQGQLWVTAALFPILSSITWISETQYSKVLHREGPNSISLLLIVSWPAYWRGFMQSTSLALRTGTVNKVGKLLVSPSLIPPWAWPGEQGP